MLNGCCCSKLGVGEGSRQLEACYVSNCYLVMSYVYLDIQDNLKFCQLLPRVGAIAADTIYMGTLIDR